MSAPRATAAILAACASALLAAGCAGAPKDSAGDFRGERKQVATTVEDLQDAGRKRDESKICDDLLSARLVAQIKQAKSTSCATAVSDALDDVDSTEIQVKAVTISGTTATARIESDDKDHDRAGTLSLVKERGRWRISALGR